MAFVYRADLKIEFRAVVYAHDSHVLEYRISPNQDLTYEKNVSLFWGLIKFTKKSKYSTSWHRAYEFVNYPTAYLYPESDGYLPIFIRDRKELESYKAKYLTIGAFFEKINREDQIEKGKWLKEREEYLKNQTTWE